MPGDLLDKFLGVGGENLPTRAYPWWVRISLLGARSRLAQWFLFWLFAAIGVVALMLGVKGIGTNDFWMGGIAALVVGFNAARTLLAVRWIDDHGSWDALQ